MKTKRHAKILELIRGQAIDTQEELLRQLREGGFDVTQATVSRDIRELRLIKTLGPDGRYRYSTVQMEHDTLSTKFHSLFADTVTGVDYAQNIVVVRCLSGMAQAAWARAAHGSEGLWSKVGKAVQAQPDYERILEASKSKRYPRTRLQRLLLCAYLGIDAQALLCEAPYVRVLAFDKTGQAVLRQAKKTGSLPLVNAGQTPPDTAYGALERRCAALYGLFAAQPELCPEQIARVYRK